MKHFIDLLMDFCRICTKEKSVCVCVCVSECINESQRRARWNYRRHIVLCCAFNN
jgi:hypothetical protein